MSYRDDKTFPKGSTIILTIPNFEIFIASSLSFYADILGMPNRTSYWVHSVWFLTRTVKAVPAPLLMSWELQISSMKCIRELKMIQNNDWHQMFNRSIYCNALKILQKILCHHSYIWNWAWLSKLGKKIRIALMMSLKLLLWKRFWT